VVELAEHGLGRVERAMDSVDDSDGYLGGILERLRELHLAACRKARPDPEALARRLLETEVRGGYDVFFDAADTYAGVLGEKGLAEYRRLAETEWGKVKPLGPGGSDPEKYGRRSTITRIMETLAKRSGDVEALVAVKSRDLSTAWDHLVVAKIYREAGKDAEALTWAEKGLRAFPERTDSRLRVFLADAYLRLGRNEDAMRLLWADFVEWPRLDRYQTLHGYTKGLGTWPEWRDRWRQFSRTDTAAPRYRPATRRARRSSSVPWRGSSRLSPADPARQRG
jgi:tetratricopeptide (TPR) repeat protein